MATLRPSLDYTDKDFDALLARMRNLLRGAFPKWTDETTANFGNMLVELFAWTGDVLTFYQDNQARESRITTATLRRSVLAAVKLIAYRPRGAVAATAELTFTLAAPPVGSVTINAGDRFRTLKVTTPISFQALAAAVIPAGADPPQIVITVEHSANSEEIFQSTALPNQQVVLNDTPFLDGSLVIAADDGIYTVVEDFLDSISTDHHATVTVDANDRATVRFGNSIMGAIPQGTINCAYKYGGGDTGNVEPDTIKKAEQAYTDEFGASVKVTVTNQEKASGGLARETVEAIRTAGPRSLRALTRSVGREDFEIHALKVLGVARALMLTANERAGIGENEGQLVIIPGGGGQPTQVLLDAVTLQITQTFPHTLTFLPHVIGPVFRMINVQATVFPRFGAGGTQAQRIALDAAIRAALTAFFALELDDGSANPTADFGLNTDGIVAFSDLYNVVRDVANVRRIGDNPADFLLNGATDDVPIAPHEFPQLGTVVLINGFTANALAAV